MVTVVIAAIVLIASLFLPWYTAWDTGCGKGAWTGVSAIHAGGWRFDLLGFTLAPLVTAILGPRLRRLTFILAAVLLCLTLFWVVTSNPPGVQGPVLSCPPGFLGIPTFNSGSGPGLGAYLGLAAAVVVLIGSRIHSAALEGSRPDR
jgi:hypothetical protein